VLIHFYHNFHKFHLFGFCEFIMKVGI